MPILLQLAQSYSNPDSVNYKIAYLRERIGDKDFGKLAFEDQVQLAMLGETISVGGFLRTELIRAKSISAEHLNVDDLAAISGNFSGNVFVGGDLLVGGQGVLSVLQYVSSGETPGWNANQGWGHCGLFQLGPGSYMKTSQGVRVYIPEKFVVTKAEIRIAAMPAFVDYFSDDFSTEYSHWKQGQSLKVYHAATDKEGYFYYRGFSGFSNVTWRDGVDVTSDVLGMSSWSPTLSYSGTSMDNTSNKIQHIVGNVVDLLTPGAYTDLYVETSATPTFSNYAQNECLLKIVVTVEGYARP